MIQSSHFVDNDGNPAGGNTYGIGFAIGWQHGPLGRNPDRQECNGAFVEDVIHAAIDRLEFYQRTKFACDYNAQAIKALNEALKSLNARTEERERRKVEGTHNL